MKPWSALPMAPAHASCPWWAGGGQRVLRRAPSAHPARMCLQLERASWAPFAATQPVPCKYRTALHCPGPPKEDHEEHAS